MDNTQQPTNILSICTGIRGLDKGLERAIGNVRTVCYVEIEAFICCNLVAEMEAGLLAPAPIWTNLKTFDAQPFCDRIHGIIGGYPCQPFSNAGNRNGTDDERHLWPYICGIIKATRPLFCFFENVEGHLTLGYDEVYRSLRNMGYKVEAGIYSAEEVGATHQRNRLFILAIREDQLANAGLFRQAQRQQPTAGIEQCSEEMGHPESFIGRLAKSIKWYDSPEPERAGEDELAYTGNIRCRTGSYNRQERHIQYDNWASSESKPKRDGWECRLEQAGTDAASDKLADPMRQRFNEVRGDDPEHDRAEPCTGNEQPSERQLANPNHLNVQRNIGCDIDKEDGRITGGRQIRPQSTVTQWPARPGEPQYEWEEPRTVEPGMGFTVDGYNFREDLLRAFGNAVVEQTAELAFIDLMNKHFAKL